MSDLTADNGEHSTATHPLDTVYAAIHNDRVVQLTFTLGGADTVLQQFWGGDGYVLTLEEARDRGLDPQPGVQSWV